VCYACRLPLQKGEQFLLRDGQLFCYRHDLEKEMFLAAAAAQHCGFVGLDEEDLLRPRDGRRGPKLHSPAQTLGCRLLNYYQCPTHFGEVEEFRMGELYGDWGLEIGGQTTEMSTLSVRYSTKRISIHIWLLRWLQLCPSGGFNVHISSSRRRSAFVRRKYAP